MPFRSQYLIEFTAPLAGWIRQRLWSSPPLWALQRRSGASLQPLLPIKLLRVYVNYSTRSASSMKVAWSILALRISLANTLLISDSNPPIVRPPLTFWSQLRTLMLAAFEKGSKIEHLEPRTTSQGDILKAILLRSTNKTWIRIGRILLVGKI